MIKRIALTLAALSLIGLAVAAYAVQNADVNIVYPIDGGSYDNYFTSSFSTTCPGGQWGVKWGFDGNTIGSSTFYDQFTGQFSHKLPTGWHTFFVSSSCGYEEVDFFVN